MRRSTALWIAVLRGQADRPVVAHLFQFIHDARPVRSALCAGSPVGLPRGAGRFRTVGALPEAVLQVDDVEEAFQDVERRLRLHAFERLVGRVPNGADVASIAVLEQMIESQGVGRDEGARVVLHADAHVIALAERPCGVELAPGCVFGFPVVVIAAAKHNAVEVDAGLCAGGVEPLIV